MNFFCFIFHFSSVKVLYFCLFLCVAVDDDVDEVFVSEVTNRRRKFFGWKNKLLLSKRQSDYHQDEPNERRKNHMKKCLLFMVREWVGTETAYARRGEGLEKRKTRNSCGWIPAVLSSMFVTDKRTIFTISIDQTFDTHSQSQPNIVELGFVGRKKNMKRKRTHLLMCLVFSFPTNKLQFIR